MTEKISVCIPVYNGAETILQSVESILRQTLEDFELIIIDNCSTDNTLQVLSNIRDKRVKILKNDKNLGCGGNLEQCKYKASGSIIFYLCADDVADRRALEKVHSAFSLSDEIGIVARPYYWFSESVSIPVRATKQFANQEIISINDDFDKISNVIALADQISGIAFRKKYMQYSFSNKHFIEMASMVMNTLKDCKAVILKDNIVAVRIDKSGACQPAVYKKSPMLIWYKLINTVYSEDRFKSLRKYLIKNFVATNFIGLVQIKNFGTYKALFREIYFLIKFKWTNIFNIRFWFFCIGTILTPRFLLKKLVVLYKNKINSWFFKNIAVS